MRYPFASVFLVAPLIAAACSSFSTTSAPDPGGDSGSGDGGTVLDTGTTSAADGASPTLGVPFVLASESGSEITARGDVVFWLSGTTALHGARALPAPTITTIESPANPVLSAGTDGASIFWLANDAVDGSSISRVFRRVLANDATTTPVPTAPSLAHLAVGPTVFSISSATEGLKVYTPGGTLKASSFHDIESPIVTETAVVYTDRHTIYETAIAGGIESRLAINLPDVSSVAADASYVYAKLSTGAIVRLTHDQRDVDASQSNPFEIATFDTQAAAILVGDGKGGLFLWSDANHALLRLDIGGGSPIALLDGLHGVTGMAASERGIFWTTSEQTVMWLPL